MLHVDAVAARTMDLLKLVASQKCLSYFRLVGGTALALQIGHRLSIDLDFFSDQKNDLVKIEEELLLLPDIMLKGKSSYALFFDIENVKLDILNYPYPFIAPAVEFEDIKLADKQDIAAMKLKTIMNRGAKRDFYDIYFLMQDYTLEQMFHFFEKKYSNIEPAAIIRSLAYFEDAEMQAAPQLLKETSITWDIVKKKVLIETRKLL